MAQLVADPVLRLSEAIAISHNNAEMANEEIIDIKSTTKQTALLTANGALLLIDHKNVPFLPHEFSIRDINIRNIVQLESSFGHFLALKKKIRPGIRDWTTKMI